MRNPRLHPFPETQVAQLDAGETTEPLDAVSKSAMNGLWMDTTSSVMRDLSRRLLAASHTASDHHIHEAELVSEKLRIPLTEFAGAEGFASLLRRALVLASAEVPSLQNLKVGSEGRLEGFDQLTDDSGIAAGGSEAAVAITAHLLGLLSTFIGERLTLRLIREAWPDTSLDE